jgi:hypothetical protein
MCERSIDQRENKTGRAKEEEKEGARENMEKEIGIK